MKNKIIGLLITLVFPGFGHIYIGSKKKGAILFVFTMIMSIFTASAPSIVTTLGLIVGYFYSIISYLKEYKIYLTQYEENNN